MARDEHGKYTGSVVNECGQRVLGITMVDCGSRFFGTTYYQTVAVTAIGQTILINQIQIIRSITATGVLTSSAIRTFLQLCAVTAIGIVILTKETRKLLSVSMTGILSLTKQINITKAIQTVGIVQIIKSISRSFSIVAVGVVVATGLIVSAVGEFIKTFVACTKNLNLMGRARELTGRAINKIFNFKAEEKK